MYLYHRYVRTLELLLNVYGCCTLFDERHYWTEAYMVAETRLEG